MPAGVRAADFDAAEKLISQPVRHANLLPSLISKLGGPTVQGSEGSRAIQALQEFFIDYHRSFSQGQKAAAESSTASPEFQHQQWVLRQQSHFLEQLTRLLEQKQHLQVQVAAMHAMMESARWCQPGSLLRFPISRLLACLLTSANTGTCLPHFINRYMEYADVRFHCLRTAARTASDLSMTAPQAGAQQAQHRAKKVKRASDLDAAGLKSQAASADHKDPKDKWRDPAQVRKAFTQAWLAFLALPLPAHLLHQVLELMHELVIPNMTTPVLLADFLIRAVDKGGATGMLALHALFLLMSRHGLEYPAFFQRLYSLLTPAMFKAKQRVRFFELADRCLASGMVPAYTAASFIKRFARLSLSASPAGAQLCLAFIHNLLRRHPACLDLLDKPAAADAQQQASGQDPYLDAEKDPAKAHALDSSLWEVEVLRNHYCPQVAAMVATLDKDLRDRKKTAEVDIHALAAASYHSRVMGLLSQRLKFVPVAFYPETPQGLFSILTKQDYAGWQLR
ncbi:hypothetical protein WJX73_008611 [Symbiochloris irregularis]|uniref:CCAAT-binding factor domain-containing protein n=1 Tax=Symbiochloris irregularis TaxID=706552 RepID=A0AAW1NSC2_9CHLO